MEKDNNILDELYIAVLIEDYAGYDTGLLAQHGVSYLVEARQGNNMLRLLFDVGQSAAPLLSNSKLLGVNPLDVDMVVLSHCHYDHTGGLTEYLHAAESKRMPIIAHTSLFRPNFSTEPSFRSFGMTPASNREAIVNAGGDLILTNDSIPLFAGVITSGEIKEKVEFEKELTLSAFTLEKGNLTPDIMADELSLFFVMPKGLVILTGCSHPGIISIVETAKKLTGIENIAAVIGGFHLVSADQGRIIKTAEALKAENCVLYTGHCTGFKAEAILLEYFKEQFHKLRTGLRIIFK